MRQVLQYIKHFYSFTDLAMPWLFTTIYLLLTSLMWTNTACKQQYITWTMADVWNSCANPPLPTMNFNQTNANFKFSFSQACKLQNGRAGQDLISLNFKSTVRVNY